MQLNNYSLGCISLASHYIFKMAAVTGCLLITFLILTDFDQVCTKIVCVQMPVFSDTFNSWSAFSFKFGISSASTMLVGLTCTTQVYSSVLLDKYMAILLKYMPFCSQS